MPYTVAFICPKTKNSNPNIPEINDPARNEKGSALEQAIYTDFNEYYIERIDLLFKYGAKYIIYNKMYYVGRLIQVLIENNVPNYRILYIYEKFLNRGLYLDYNLRKVAIYHDNYKYKNRNLLFLAKFLLENGANPKAVYFGKTIIKKAKQLGKKDLVKLMKQYK